MSLPFGVPALNTVSHLHSRAIVIATDVAINDFPLRLLNYVMTRVTTMLSLVPTPYGNGTHPRQHVGRSGPTFGYDPNKASCRRSASRSCFRIKA